jgi:hypothetical protein
LKHLNERLRFQKKKKKSDEDIVYLIGVLNIELTARNKHVRQKCETTIVSRLKAHNKRCAVTSASRKEHGVVSKRQT